MHEQLLTNVRKLRIYKSRNLKFDAVSGLVVFLVAIPLCLGVALASGAPLLSGIVSGIIGGIVVASLSSSAVSVSGPAAGMAAVVATSINHLGGFESFLLALTLAGLIQLAIGLLRAGFIADYVPSNVVQGLLCAIGILLILKQLPFAFTHSTHLSELKSLLLDTSEGFRLKPLLALSFHINSGAMLLSVLSFALLIYFEKTKIAFLKPIPGAIVVVILGIGLNELFVYTDSYLAQNSPQLVNIPQHEGIVHFFQQMPKPNWAAFTNPSIYLYAIIIAVVASLETLLNIKAADKLDKKRRTSSKDRELLAQGVGNCFAGLLGGIPVTSVIVRTSVNIQAGSKTKMSAIFHGLFILFAVILIPNMLNKIPLSSLAAILIYTGYKLTKPSIYLSIYKQGWDRFIPFIVTTVSIIEYNLLEGILIGLSVSLFFILKSNSQTRFDIIKENYPNGITNRLVLPQQTSFLNKASLVAELESIAPKSQLIIDARHSNFIDKEIIELIKDFKAEQAPQKQISLNLMGFKDKYDIHNYIDFINVTTYDVQSTITPSVALNILREGNLRFQHDTRIHRSVKSDIEYTAKTQHPIAVVLGCIDSRVPVETIFDMSFGDLFCIRIAGNVVNDDVLASIEYACAVVGAKLIVVLGHTRCGAICAACDNVKEGHITQLLNKIKPAIQAEKEITTERNSQNGEFVQKVTELNIGNTLQHIYHESSILKSLINEEKLGLSGALYDVNTGRVHFHDFSKTVLQLDPKGNPELAIKLQDLRTSINKPEPITL